MSTKKRASAMRAKAMLDAGVEPQDAAQALGYRSVSGMMGAIRRSERANAVPETQMKTEQALGDEPIAEEAAFASDEEAADEIAPEPVRASETTILVMGGVRVVKRRGEYLVKIIQTTNNMRFAFGDEGTLRDVMTALRVVARDMDRHWGI